MNNQWVRWLLARCTFSLWIASATGSLAGSVAVLSEGFENGFPAAGGWSVGDANSSTGFVYWNDVSSAFGGRAPHGGSYKAYCAGYGYAGTPANPSYRVHMNSFMEKTVSLSNATSATLSFWSLAPSFEVGVDVPRVFINGHLAWDLQTLHTNWTLVTINLQSNAGANCIIDFRFWSDHSVVGEGWYVDDILVTKSKPDVNLRPRLVTVARPVDSGARSFTSCTFRVDNLGQTLSNGTLTAQYTLSSNTSLGDADDRLIGETVHSNVTIAASGFHDVVLDSAGRSNMVKYWTPGLATAGVYYVFVNVACDPAKGDEADPSNNAERTGTTFAYTAGNAWDSGYTPIGGNWRRLSWFGDYVPMGDDGWFWHNKHGFLFSPPANTPSSIWLYAQDMGWLWTANATYPFLYRSNDDAWLWYNGSTNPRWFRNMTANRWESW